MTVLSATNVRRAFDGTTALAGVSIAIDAGTVFALVGPNGAGKTTLIRCLTGTLRADEGSVALFGEDPRRVDPARIGVLPQSFKPADRLTARELITYHAGLYDEARSVDAVLDAVGLTDAADTRYRHLSGGQQRRTLLGTTLVNDPYLLVLDEPTTGIDPAGRRAVWGVLEELVSEGTTVLLTTHSMAEVERLADRVGILVDGSLRAIGTPSSIVEEHGSGPRLAIRTRSEPPLIDRPVRSTQDGFRIDDVPAAALGDLVETLVSAGIDLEAVSWRAPSLESVYLDLTAEAGDTGGDEL